MADIESQEESNKVGCIEKLKNSLISSIEVERDLKMFFILLCVGCALILFSTFFLLTILLKPKPFVSLFSLGSFVLIVSFIFLHGTQRYFEILFDRSRLVYTITYFITLILGFVFSAVKSLYFASLFISAVQVFVTIIFILSFIPGGKAGISMMMTSVNPMTHLTG